MFFDYGAKMQPMGALYIYFHIPICITYVDHTKYNSQSSVKPYELINYDFATINSRSPKPYPTQCSHHHPLYASSTVLVASSSSSLT